jgi:hypothetical protein
MLQLTIQEILQRHKPLDENATASSSASSYYPRLSAAHQQHEYQPCIDEVKAFVRGGTPGLARLAEVYPSILLHFNMNTDVLYYRVMHDAGVPWDTCKSWRLPSSYTNHRR